MKVRSDFLSNLALIVPSLPIKATSTKLSIGSKDALLSIQRYLDVLEGILPHQIWDGDLMILNDGDP